MAKSKEKVVGSIKPVKKVAVSKTADSDVRKARDNYRSSAKFPKARTAGR